MYLLKGNLLSLSSFGMFWPFLYHKEWVHHMNRGNLVVVSSGWDWRCPPSGLVVADPRSAASKLRGSHLRCSGLRVDGTDLKRW